MESFEKFLVQVLCAKPLSLNIHILEVRVKLKACGKFVLYNMAFLFIHGYFTALNAVADIFVKGNLLILNVAGNLKL